MQDPAPQDQGEGTWTPNKGVSMFYKAVKMGQSTMFFIQIRSEGS